MYVENQCVVMCVLVLYGIGDDVKGGQMKIE
jgi:hypothetical protein